MSLTKCPNDGSTLIETEKDFSCPKCQYGRSKPSPKKGNKHVEEVNKVIKGLLMEARISGEQLPWTQPWIIIPKRNYDSNRQYNGLNRWLLSFDSEISYITKDSVEKKGLTLKDEAKERLVIAWVPPRLSKKEKAELSKEKQAELMRKRYPRMFTHLIYRSKDVEGLEPKTYEEDKNNKRYDSIEEFIKQTGAKFEEGSNQPAYRPGTDAIVMPRIEQYPDSEQYYRDALHELAHWTAHKDRLNRDAVKFKANEDYGREELIAEMASAYMCRYFGIDVNENTVAYIDGWLRAIDSDPYLLVSAGQQAEKVLTYFNLNEES